MARVAPARDDAAMTHSPTELRPHAAINDLLRRARRLTPDEIAALDAAEDEYHDLLVASWDMLRDASTHEARRHARRAAWSAVGDAAEAAGLARPADPGPEWRAARGPAYGAARAARYAATALVAGDRLDPDYRDALLRPWREVIGPV